MKIESRIVKIKRICYTVYKRIFLILDLLRHISLRKPLAIRCSLSDEVLDQLKMCREDGKSIHTREVHVCAPSKQEKDYHADASIQPLQVGHPP